MQVAASLFLAYGVLTTPDAAAASAGFADLFASSKVSLHVTLESRGLYLTGILSHRLLSHRTLPMSDSCHARLLPCQTLAVSAWPLRILHTRSIYIFICALTSSPRLFASPPQLVHVSSIDFAILSAFAFEPIREDMCAPALATLATLTPRASPALASLHPLTLAPTTLRTKGSLLSLPPPRLHPLAFPFLNL